jgi:glycerol transport system ATP-binding protein
VAAIELRNLSFCYPGAAQPTLEHLNLVVRDGEAHALLGASGAGKTTLLSVLSGLLAPTSGEVLFDGASVGQLAGRDRHVAQVFQFPVLYESMSVAQNLAFPLRRGDRTPAQIQSRIVEIAAELGIEQVLSAKPRTLSLFEKQLVAVGKALVREDVALVLLDEPLTAVEPKIKWRLRQTLRKAQEDLGVTMIYVTHDQTEALTFADRVSLLTEEGILQTGTPEEIYQSPEHEFVGHFVGSPGMNFLPAGSLGITPGERIGFRPEWARLVDEVQTEKPGTLQGTVAGVRVLGTRAGQPVGQVRITSDLGEITLRGVVDVVAGQAVSVEINRYVVFDQARKIGEFADA